MYVDAWRKYFYISLLNLNLQNDFQLFDSVIFFIGYIKLLRGVVYWVLSGNLNTSFWLKKERLLFLHWSPIYS